MEGESLDPGIAVVEVSSVALGGGRGRHGGAHVGIEVEEEGGMVRT